MARVAILFIKFYQKFISRFIFTGRNCRFYPTCSQYSIDAYNKYGFLKGTYLSMGRVLRCHPFSEGGYDPLK